MPDQRPDLRSAGTTRPVVVVNAHGHETARQMALAAGGELAAYYASRGPAGRDAATGPLATATRRTATMLDALATGAALVRLSGAGATLLARRDAMIDARVARELPAGATVVAQAGACARTFRRARLLYGRAVLDHPDALPSGGAARERAVEAAQAADIILVASQEAADSFAGVSGAGAVRVLATADSPYTPERRRNTWGRGPQPTWPAYHAAFRAVIGLTELSGTSAQGEEPERRSA